MVQKVEHITKLDDNKTCDVYYLEIQIDDVQSHASNLISLITENSWINQLDPIAKVSFETKVNNTANALTSIFTDQSESSTVKDEFGEYMISIDSAQSLKDKLQHFVFPLAELWKEKVTNNHGFDFHTQTPDKLLAFGEAKYVSSGNAYGRAAEQVVRFISDEEKKDLGDLIFLKSLGADESAIDSCLNQRKKDFILGFSVNSENSELIKKNALQNENVLKLIDEAETLFLVGVHVI